MKNQLKHSLLLLFFSSCTFFFVQAQISVQTLSCSKGQKIEIRGDLTQGTTIPIDWAQTSQVACFPSTRKQEFQGKHVFYRVDLPRNSRMIITVIPQKKKRINIYGIRQSTNVGYQSVPPNIRSAVCEADYPQYAGKTNMKKGGETQDIEFMAINNPYSILIGVAGAVGVKSGGYRLQVEIKDR